MRSFKLFAAALLITCASAVSAQCTGHAAHGTSSNDKAQASFLKQELGLNDEQSSKVEALLASNDKEVAALGGKNDEATKASIDKMNASTYAQIGTVLQPEQAKKFEALKASGKLAGCEKGSGKSCCAGAATGSTNAKPACCAGKGHAETAKPAAGSVQ